ncbi:MAG: replicative DNA helicase [Gammaproteobacteria bacterium]|nr:replicative DNA helicase [Gammaproteobacteria bacterium]
MATAAQPFPSPADDSEPRQLSVPPHSRDAEQAVLGGLMLDGNAWYDVSDVLQLEDFYFPEHRQIFEAIVAQDKQSKPIDVLTLADALIARGKLDAAGGADYLGDLAENARGTANLRHYAEIVRDRAILRSLISAGNKIIDNCYNTEGAPVEDILDQAERRIFGIADDRPNSDGPEEITPLLGKAVDRIEELTKLKGSITGLPSPFTELDQMTSGWQNSDLIIVAARPGMGKTAFALNLVEHAILHQELPALVFSFEMSSQSLVFRLLASNARVNQSNVRRGKMSREEWPKFRKAVGRMKDRPLYIDDSFGLSPNEMRSRARRIAQMNGGRIGMIVVDYLQLMHLKGFREGRVNEISEISRSMKQMAREFDCPVVALSQLNREVDKRPNKRPQMSDLRESGAIEQDADLILFLYRAESYYKEETKEEEKGVAEVIVGKHRNGETGKIKLTFLDELIRFENRAKEDDYAGYGPV